jgi:hypothetical protein
MWEARLPAWLLSLTISKKMGLSRRLRGANNVDGKRFIVRADEKLTAFYGIWNPRFAHQTIIAAETTSVIH